MDNGDHDHEVRSAGLRLFADSINSGRVAVYKEFVELTWQPGEQFQAIMSLHHRHRHPTGGT